MNRRELFLALGAAAISAPALAAEPFCSGTDWSTAGFSDAFVGDGELTLTGMVRDPQLIVGQLRWFKIEFGGFAHRFMGSVQAEPPTGDIGVYRLSLSVPENSVGRAGSNL